MALLRIGIAVVLFQLLLAGCSLLEPTKNTERAPLEGCCGSLMVEPQEIV